MIAFPSPRLAGTLAFAAQLLSTSLSTAQTPESPTDTSAEGDAAAPPDAAALPVPPPAEGAGAAAPAAPPPAEEPPPEPSGEPEKKKLKKKDRFEPKGRVIARAELARREVDFVTADAGVEPREIDSLDLALESVRAGFRYTSPIERVTATLSVEFAGKVKLKDGYADYEGDVFGARAGQFKAPTSPIDADGRLSLPTADRGFIHEILSDRLEIGGRRPGLVVSARSEGDFSARFALGAFQGSYVDDEATRDTELLSAQSLGAQSLLARGEVAFDALELGGYVTYRVGTDGVPALGEEPEHFWAGALDAKLDLPVPGGGLRLWLDGTLGESWYSESRQDGDPTFVSGRLIAALRFGGADKGDFYLEPYGSAGALDPDLRVTSDLAWEGALGLNVGFWKRGRLTFQGGAQRTLKNFPESYALGFYRNRRSLIAQVAVEF
jgi:hypothetical protein